MTREETMRWTHLARNALLGVSLLCLGLPEAEALEIFAPPGVATHMDDGLITLRGASGVELDFVPTAIARKYDPPAAVPESSDDEHHEEGDSK